MRKRSPSVSREATDHAVVRYQLRWPLQRFRPVGLVKNAWPLTVFSGFALLAAPPSLEGAIILGLTRSHSLTSADLLAAAVVSAGHLHMGMVRVRQYLQACLHDADVRALLVLTGGCLVLSLWFGDGVRWLSVVAGALHVASLLQATGPVRNG
jgi:hypothetical protein